MSEGVGFEVAGNDIFLATGMVFQPMKLVLHGGKTHGRGWGCTCGQAFVAEGWRLARLCR